MYRLLLLEDDRSLIEGLKYSLEKNGFALETAHTVSEARTLLEEGRMYDLLLLDITLPDGTGFEICDMVRRKDHVIPIIFLTASDQETNIIRGLDSGGDDYITKPFRLGELCSRIRAMLRRAKSCSGFESGCLYSGALSIHLISGRVLLNGQPLELTAVEYRLLCLLVQNTGQTLTRNTILNALWDGNGNFVDDNTLSVYIRRLRGKIETDPSEPAHLLTVRGFGYRWKE